MAQLAIKGHATRGKEVIQLLEMLGGKNKYNLRGDTNEWFVLNGAQIQRSSVIFSEKGFILEDFEEKFPYKVGDKVILDKSPCIITGMSWYRDDVIYYVKGDGFSKDVCSTDKDLQPYEEIMEEKRILSQIDLTKEMNVNDEIEVILGDYEFIFKDGKTYFIKKKPQYPKDYLQCCECLGHNPFSNNVSGYKRDIIESLQTLITCRNAYWKIAGEEMGYIQHWQPDWNNLSSTHEFIQINKGCFTYSSRVLVFPTEEMRDAFYENFKDLIVQCKELL